MYFLFSIIYATLTPLLHVTLCLATLLALVLDIQICSDRIVLKQLPSNSYALCTHNSLPFKSPCVSFGYLEMPRQNSLETKRIPGREINILSSEKTDKLNDIICIISFYKNNFHISRLNKGTKYILVRGIHNKNIAFLIKEKKSFDLSLSLSLFYIHTFFRANSVKFDSSSIGQLFKMK